jgi:predicted dehydrogenase
MKTIGLIGAGQLGSRHLQALAKSAFPLDIRVLDTSEANLAIAETRFAEVAADFRGKISFHQTFSSFNAEYDVVIIATGSSARRKVIEELLQHSTVKHLVLEKFLFPRLEDYAAVDALLAKKHVSSFVNCPRRTMSVYKQIKAEISGPINFFVNGNAWGLACNAIHFIDLFSFLTDSTEYFLDAAQIDPVIHESKRPDYIEFTGAVHGLSDRNFFHIASHNAPPSGLQVIIHTPSAKYSVAEGANGTIWKSRQENNWAWEESNFTMPFQSQLSNLFVDQLLETGTCDLTPYVQSARLHEIYLSALLKTYRDLKNDPTISECPIT